MDDRIEPTRARPVPFCRQSLRPDPATSPRPLVLCVPARSPAKYQRTASCNRCGFTWAANTASASSTWPTVFPCKFLTSTTAMKRLSSLSLLRALGLADQEIATGWTGNSSAHQQKILLGIDLHYAQILYRLALMPHVPGKMLSRPYSRRERAGADASRRAMEHGTM